MKKLFFAMLVVLLAAGSAWAVDVNVSGGYYARGSMITNDAGTATQDAATYMYYDHDFDLTAKFVVSEATMFTLVLEFQDEEWGTAQSTTAGSDDNMEVKRGWLTHKFPTNTILDVGAMNAGGWATAFDDDVGEGMRVKLTQISDFGVFGGLFQKVNEAGQANPNTKDAESDDTDVLMLFLITKLGPINVKPAYALYHYGRGPTLTNALDGENDLTRNRYVLALDGTFGMIGFECEFTQNDYSFERNLGTDYTIGGYYANVWANLDAFKVGGIFAYGSVDEDSDPTNTAPKKYGFDGDFDLTLFLGDWMEFGGNGADSGISGSTAFQIYAAYAMDKFSFGGSYTIVNSNVDNNKFSGTQWYKASASEFDLNASYKITDSLTYSVAAGWANVDWDDTYSTDDPEGAFRGYHKLALSF